MSMIKTKDLIFEYDKRDEEGNVIGVRRAIDEVNLDMSYIRCVGAKKERIIPFGEEAKNALDMYFKNTRGNLVKKSEIEKQFGRV